MDYKKINDNNYSLHLINYDRFKTINVDVYFSRKFKKEDIPYINLLVKLLTYSTKKYNNKTKFAINLENLYNSLIRGRYSVIGTVETVLISFEFINPIYTESGMYNESFSFLKEVLFNPNQTNKKFDKQIFELIKKNLIREIKSLKEKPNLLAYENFIKNMYKGTSSSYSLFGEEKDYESINEKNLYDFYLDFITSSKIDVIVLGENNENIITKEISKIFKNVKNSSNKLNNIYIKSKIKDKVLIKKETYSFNQSIVYMGYKFNDLSEYELKYVLSVYNIMLGSMNNSVLFTEVRERKSYCYNISSSVSRYNTSLIVHSGINKDNYENVVNEIKRCINLMKDKNIVSNLFETAMKTVNTYLNDYYDNMYSILEHYYLNEFDMENDIEKKREIYNRLTVEDIIILGNKIKLDTIYFMEGIANE